MLKIREGLENLQGYSVEEERFQIKLDANEGAYNLPTVVLEKVRAALTSLDFNRYPDIGMVRLRTQIADSFGLKLENILIGSGSSAILEVLCYVFGGNNRSIVFPSPSFSMYGIYAKMSDSKGVPVPLNKDFTLDREAMLAAAERENANLLIVCNPNNPTGTLIPFADIEYIIAGAKCPVVIDEAYYEFHGGPSAVELLSKYPHLIVARTFSKAYSLASARVGYMLADPKLIAMVEKGFTPYHVSAISLATAEVVYENRTEFQPTIQQAATERQRIAAALAAIDGIDVFPSASNFVLFRLKEAVALNQYLMDKSIGVRSFGTAPGLEGCIRVNAGTPEENTAFIIAVQQFQRGE